MALLLPTTAETEAEARRLLAARDRDGAVKLLLPAVETALGGAEPATELIAADDDGWIRELEELTDETDDRFPDRSALPAEAFTRECIYEDEV